jgi:hypothetical protein
MKKASLRKFKVKDKVFIIDHWWTTQGPQAFSARAEIVKVDKKNKIFTAVLYGDTYQKYSFKDVGRLIFGSKSEADTVVDTLPLPNTRVFQKIGKNTYKKTVKGVIGKEINGIYDLVVTFNRGKELSIKEIGKTLFLEDKEDANE